ncbi:MAG: DUF1007 family protein [Xanthobacteraceae bacterium]|nr:DUF1007 family protein [Xanthobacteraceae bacterium]
MKPKAIIRLLAAAAFVAAGSLSALSHPHVATTVKSEIVFNKEGAISGVRYAWTFDEFFSEFATQGLDTNKDGVLSREELAELAKVNVESLKESDYFTFGKSGEAKLEFGEPTDYWLEFKDKLLTLYFTLPVKAVRKGGVALDVYDPTYFVAFGFAKDNPVKLVNAPANCSLEVKRPAQVSGPAQPESFFNSLSRASEYGSQFANSAIVTCK